MAVSKNLAFAHLDDLYLDPLNPRLGRNNMYTEKSQDEILNLMGGWTLEELAHSYLESGGFWTHEALLVVDEGEEDEKKLVVVEGNRRLATLKFLYKAIRGENVLRKWRNFASGLTEDDELFVNIPYLLVDSRKDIAEFLGFRHVTGIKEWKPAEKAQYISSLVDDYGLTYEEVMRKIGSKTTTVRRHYISYRLLLQLEEIEELSVDKIEERFSVMYLSLRTRGVQNYLQINIHANPEEAVRPVPTTHLENLKNFALWLFGTDEQKPLVKDSRRVEDFGLLLENEESLEYLESRRRPNFDMAFQLAGGDELQIVQDLNQASDYIQLSLARVHHFRDSEKIRKAVATLSSDAWELLKKFPKIMKEITQED